MTELWLVRHGQTNWNLNGRWQGQALDAPGLNDVGRAQALILRDQLKDVHFSAIYSSDLLRALQTAEIIAEPSLLDIIQEPLLREIHLGNWEGMLASEIGMQYPNGLANRARDPLSYGAPGGETLVQLAERVVGVTREIAEKHSEGSVLIVSHGVALAAVICHIKGIALSEVYEHIPENSKAYRLLWNGSFVAGDISA